MRPRDGRLRSENDWVVLYFHSDGESEGQRTVVTETRGALAGCGVVRGREDESLLLYAEARPEPSSSTSGDNPVAMPTQLLDR